VLVQQLCTARVVVQQQTVKYAPQKNGAAARAIGVVCTMARALHREGGLQSQWWGPHRNMLHGSTDDKSGEEHTLRTFVWGQARFGSLESVWFTSLCCHSSLKG
jgi:hypothetical protein